MASISAHYEGQTNGTAITVANSSANGDTAVNTITQVSMTMNYSTTQKAHSAASLQFAGALTANATGYLKYAGLNATTQCRAQFYTYFTAWPTGNLLLGGTCDTNGSTIYDALYIRADGTPMFHNTSAGGYPTGTALTLNTWYRWDFTKVIATSGGSAQVTITAGDATTGGQTIGNTNANTGSATVAQFHFGKHQSAETIDVFYMDDLRVDDTSSTAYTPWVPVANQPPVTTISPTKYTGTLGSAISITGSASDPDGSISSVAWTCTSYPGTAPTLSGAATNTVTFTPATAGVYQFRFTATDNSGANPTTPATCTVYVPASTVSLNANPSNTGSWTGSYTDLSDSSDSTYVQSTGSGTDTFTFNPATPSTSAYVTVRAAYVDAGATINWTLLQGSNTVASGVISGLTASAANYTLNLTSAQINSITDWTALQIAFS